MSVPYIVKSLNSFNGTTSAGGYISKTYTANELGVTKIVGLANGGIQTLNSYQIASNHYAEIEISATGQSAQITWYVSYGGASVNCYGSLICIE